ncbi:MAG: hypothetical protein FJ090_14520 [Deltaproteobacteria bacterium]|nr:hypothetical protein [Deltaproteobacteria bacterium]
MRFRASPLVVAVALGLLNPSVLVEESRSRSRAKPSNSASLEEEAPVSAVASQPAGEEPPTT